MTDSSQPLPSSDGRSTRLALLRPGTTGFTLLMLLLGFVAFAFTAVANHLTLERVRVHAEQRDHANETQVLISQLDRLLMDIEIGQRGYLLTGQERDLDPYVVALLKLDAAQAMLQSQLERATGDSRATARLEDLIERRLEQAHRVITVRRAGIFVSPFAEAQGSHTESWPMTDGIRNELERLAREQDQRLRVQNSEVYSVAKQSEFLSIALPLVGTLLVVAAVRRLVYERRRRDEAEATLRRVNATLETQVTHRTAQLQSALSRIQSFASELDTSIETERRRLARELHDQFGQTATALRIIVMGLRRQDPPVSDAIVNELLALVDEAIGMARRISAALRPPLLDDLGLAAATEHFTSALERQSGLKVQCDISDDEGLSPHQANQLFRVIQEATTNVLRHAFASEVRIRGHVDGTLYRLDIVDNGVGPGSVRADASGVRNMRERAKLIGGDLLFGPAVPAGTQVSVLMPLAAPLALPHASGTTPAPPVSTSSDGARSTA